MTRPLDEGVLDDVEQLARLDPSEMLPAVASAGPQLREAAMVAAETIADRLTPDDRPRSLVVAGMGGSAVAGDVLAGVLDSTAVPVAVHRGPGLPAWVGATDFVAAVSCSGSTEETLSATTEAVRRGLPVLGIGAAGSPLATLVEASGGVFVPVRARLAPRATLWGLVAPLLVAADRLRLSSVPERLLEASAHRLDLVAAACRPDRESFVNPAKDIALQFSGRLPVIWGVDALTGVAARRAACQLHENAKYPCIFGELPEAAHNQVVMLDGPFAGDDEDIFADRLTGAGPVRLRLLLLRDPPEDARTATRADVARDLAVEHGVPAVDLAADGESPLERLASLIGVLDHASVYLALTYGLDPTPIAPITAVKARLG